MISQLLYVLIISLSTKNVLAQCVQTDEPAIKAISSSANVFAHNFFKEVAKNESGNFITSSVGVHTVLSMANVGAKGSTEKELESVLRLPCDKSISRTGYQKLIELLNNVKGVELKLANQIFTTNKYELQPEFAEILEKYFKSTIQTVDFEKPTEAVKIINNWCANKTNNRITEIFEADDVRDSAAVLVNAVYFKGQWANKFKPEFTAPAPFYTGQNWKNVSMMGRYGTYHWGSIPELNAQFVELPYASENPEEGLSMFIILPNELHGLKNVEDNMEKINFARLSGSRGTIGLFMPKFKIESKFNLELTLKKMGITEIFDERKANLSGMIKGFHVKVNKIIQKAFIEVNEEGSEAAAATGLIQMPVSLPPEIAVNKPFFATIVSKPTGTQLFSARIINPMV